jgi:hypothetical protein
MSLQRNVQQKVDAETAAIRRAATIGAAQKPWLLELLHRHGLVSKEGILVRYSEVPEQEGTLILGLWLTYSLGIWEFEVVVARENQMALSVEKFVDVTASFPAVSIQPGAGPSFGYLAHMVLHENRDT